VLATDTPDVLTETTAAFGPTLMMATACVKPTTWYGCCHTTRSRTMPSGPAELAQIKPTATLTHIARGGIGDDAALAVALRKRRIAAAGLDVFKGEPKLHPDLLSVATVVLAPHIASSTLAARRAMADLAVRFWSQH